MINININFVEKTQKKNLEISPDARELMKLLNDASLECGFTQFFIENNSSVVRTTLRYNRFNKNNSKYARRVTDIIYDRHANRNYFTIVYSAAGESRIMDLALTTEELHNIRPLIHRIIRQKQFHDIRKGF